jgi:hypothetical protein
MLIFRKEILLKIIVIPLLLILSGCSERPESLCFDKQKKLEITTKSCKPLNEFSKSINIVPYDPLNEPIYDSSVHLTEDEINTYNNRQIKLNTNTKTIHKTKEIYAKTLLSYLVFLMLIIVPIALVKSLKGGVVEGVDGRETKFLNASLMLLILCSLFYYVYSSDDFSVRLKNGTNAIGQFIFTLGATVELSETRMEKSSISSSSKNEALRDIEAMHKINICLSNNQKSHLERLENTWNRLISQKDIVDFYYKKNTPYLKFYEKRTNQKISYMIDKYGVINSISFANCGEIKTNKNIMAPELLEIMEYVNFNNIIHNAIKSKALESGWNTISTKYKSKYFDTGKAKRRLMQLAILYLSEYKKGLLIGSVEVDYEAGKSSDYLAGTKPVIDFDSSNLEYFLSNSDEIYSNINQSICLPRADLINDTINRIEEFDTTQHMSQYDCVDFKNKKLVSSSTSNKIYNNDNQFEIDINIARIVEKTRDLVDASTTDLISEYKKVDDLYLTIINDLYNFEKDVNRILNRGYFAMGDFYKYTNTQSNEYLTMFSELNDVLDISFAKALPNYSSGNDATESNLYAYESGYINYFMTPIFDKIDTSQSSSPSNYSSIGLEVATDTSSYNIDKEELFSVSNVENLFTTGVNAMSNVFNSVKRMTCNDGNTCLDEQKDYNGVLEIQNLSSNLKTGAAFGLAVGFTGKVSAMTLDAVATHKAKSSFKMGKKKKRVSFGRAIKSAGNMINGVSNFMIVTSVIALVLSALLDFIFKIEQVFMIYVQLSQMLYLNYVDFFILNAIAVGVAIGKSTKAYHNTLLYCFNLVIYAPLFALSVGLIVILNNFLRTWILNILPFISETAKAGVDDGSIIMSIALPAIQITLNLAIIIFGIKWFFKYIISKFKPVVDKAIKGGLEGVEDFINEKENAKFYTAVYASTQLVKQSNSPVQDKQQEKQPDSKK